MSCLFNWCCRCSFCAFHKIIKIHNAHLVMVHAQEYNNSYAIYFRFYSLVSHVIWLCSVNTQNE